jgi:hypothetical protein
MGVDEMIAGAGAKFGTALAGLAGGVARVVFMGQTNQIGWKRAIGLVFLGAICAGYLTPLLGLLVTVPPDGPLERALGFVIGLLSMTLVEVVLRFADWLREDPGRLLDLIRRRPPGSTGSPGGQP